MCRGLCWQVNSASGVVSFDGRSRGGRHAERACYFDLRSLAFGTDSM